VIFLAEAFTRPAMLHTLAKVGFHQSYTYFAWRNSKDEVESYLAELAHDSADFLRPNLFVNTPDILHAYLQEGGPPAFAVRATLAATGSPSWGMYSGFELFEHVALRPGSEEYLDSEKYQLRPRDWAAAEREGRSLAPYIRRLNDIRRRHPALAQLRDLTVHSSDGDAFACFSKRHEAADDTVIVVVNLDPRSARDTIVHLDMPALGMDWDTPFEVHDEVSGRTFVWGSHNYVRLDPAQAPAHILTVRKAPR
jgi:starch synthase (maltosyl-transferring)